VRRGTWCIVVVWPVLLLYAGGRVKELDVVLGGEAPFLLHGRGCRVGVVVNPRWVCCVPGRAQLVSVVRLSWC